MHRFRFPDFRSRGHTFSGGGRKVELVKTKLKGYKIVSEMKCAGGCCSFFKNYFLIVLFALIILGIFFFFDLNMHIIQN